MGLNRTVNCFNIFYITSIQKSSFPVRFSPPEQPNRGSLSSRPLMSCCVERAACRRSRPPGLWSAVQDWHKRSRPHPEDSKISLVSTTAYTEFFTEVSVSCFIVKSNKILKILKLKLLLFYFLHQMTIESLINNFTKMFVYRMLTENRVLYPGSKINFLVCQWLINWKKFTAQNCFSTIKLLLYKYDDLRLSLLIILIIKIHFLIIFWFGLLVGQN